VEELAVNMARLDNAGGTVFTREDVAKASSGNSKPLSMSGKLSRR
jgi:hypothetical protein